jgi:hypothetical protein
MTNQPASKPLTLSFVVYNPTTGLTHDCGTEIEADLLARLLNGTFSVVWA